MSQMIQFLDTSSMNTCKKAVAPIVYQATEIVAELTGDVPVTPAGLPIAAGAPMQYGGQVVVQGCFDVEATITYFEGDDCDPCTTPDTLTPVDVTVVIPANSSFPLPDGFWSDIEFVTVDNTGTATALPAGQTETVRFYSCYTPECPNCAVVVPAP